MACCLVAALLFGVAQRAWFWLFPARKPVQVDFAPAAWRPAPGRQLVPQERAVSTRRRISWGWLPIGAAAGIAWYAVLLDVLAIFGAVHLGGHGTVRTALLAVGAACLLGVGVRTQPDRRSVDLWAFVLTGAGVAWSMASIADMHVFGFVELSTHAFAPDVAFHGVGFALAMLGAARCLAMPKPQLTR